MKRIIRKIAYVPIFIVITPFMGIIGFFAYIGSLWKGWWKLA